MQKVVIADESRLGVKEAETFKTIRTNLLCVSDNVKSILVTSCMPGEGKTMVSFNLAISMSEIGKKVLFVDGDMRKAGMMTKYGIVGKVKGLSQFLRGQVTLDEAICETNMPKFDIVFSGSIPANPSELLESKAFSNFMKQTREKYDYVIVDTPALGSVIDGAIIARECDGAVIVTAYGTKNRRETKKVINQVKETNTAILGIVLNKAVERTKR